MSEKWRHIPRIDPNNLRNGLFMVGPKEFEILFERSAKNRGLNNASLARLISDINADEWHITPDALGFTADGRFINGQHRGRACIATGRTLPFYVVVGIDEKAFAVIDAGSKRTAADLFAINGHKHTSICASIARLELCYRARTLAPRINARQILAVAEELPYMETAVRTIVAVRKDLHGWCSPAAMGWVYMHALGEDAEKAIDWFDGIAKGTNLAETDPRFAARRRLIRNPTRMQHAQSVLEQIYVLWRSWELFRSGARTTTIQLPRNAEGNSAALWPKAA